MCYDILQIPQMKPVGNLFKNKLSSKLYILSDFAPLAKALFFISHKGA